MIDSPANSSGTNRPGANGAAVSQSPDADGPGTDGPGTDGGFTLVEAVVATALVTLVAGLVLVTYLLAARQVARWQAGLTAENALHVVQSRIASDLRHAERIVWDEREGLELVGSDSARVAYVLRDSALVRNGRPMHGTGLTTSSLDVVLREFEGKQEYPDALPLSSGTLSLGSRGSELGSRGSEDADTVAPEGYGVYVEVRLGLIRRGEESQAVIGAHLRKPTRWAPTRSLRSQRPPTTASSDA